MESVPKDLKPFVFHGVDFAEACGDDFVADCPFCGKERAFSANGETTKWTCHSRASKCGRSGNATSFLSQLAEAAASRTTASELGALEEARGIPARAFTRCGVGYWPATERWLVPVLGSKGQLTDLRTWAPGRKLMSTAGRKSGMFGSETLPGAKRVWLCEGEWDAMAMRWLLRECGERGDAVASLPGARSLKPEWVALLRGKKVTVCGDNDEDGDRMAEKVWRALGGVGVDFVNWPDSLPTKYDVRDFVSARTKNPARALAALRALLSPKHRRMPFVGAEDVVVAATGVRESQRHGEVKGDFASVLKTYSEHLRMTDDMEAALAALYAVQLSTQWPGDPLWLFLVGAPGSGKTELLLSMSEAPDTVYQSSIDSRSLCSGFKGKTDPSLIPKIIGRCAIFKDWTELLEAHPTELQKTYAVLRGAYDGMVDRNYGNEVSRKYVGTFHLLAGVTNKVHAHGTATVGERFLKFQLRRPPKGLRDEVVWAAMMGVTKEQKKNEALKTAAREFLDRKAEPPDPMECLGLEYATRIRAVACLTAAVRADVTWAACGYEREVQFRPDDELPTRLGKQLVKLAMAACAVYGHDRVGPAEWAVVERVAMNTAYGYHMDVLEAVMASGGRDVSVAEVEDAANMPRFTLDRRLGGMAVLGLVRTRREKRAQGPGAPQNVVTVAPSIRRLWREAGIERRHAQEGEASRRTATGYDRA
jgi:hypothetical protein